MVSGRRLGEDNSSKNYWELLLLSDGCGYVGIATAARVMLGEISFSSS